MNKFKIWKQLLLVFYVHIGSISVSIPIEKFIDRNRNRLIGFKVTFIPTTFFIVALKLGLDASFSTGKNLFYGLG